MGDYALSSARTAESRIASGGSSTIAAQTRRTVAWSARSSAEQLTVLTGYKRSSRDTYIQRLQAAGLVDVRGGLIFATDAGIDALGPDFEPLPTGEALREYWLDRLGGGEREILSLLIDAGGDPVSREIISEATPYKRSSRDSYLQRLAARKLVESVGRGEVRASRLLFDEAAR